MNDVKMFFELLFHIITSLVGLYIITDFLTNIKFYQHPVMKLKTDSKLNNMNIEDSFRFLEGILGVIIIRNMIVDLMAEYTIIEVLSKHFYYSVAVLFLLITERAIRKVIYLQKYKKPMEIVLLIITTTVLVKLLQEISKSTVEDMFYIIVGIFLLIAVLINLFLEIGKSRVFDSVKVEIVFLDQSIVDRIFSRYQLEQVESESLVLENVDLINECDDSYYVLVGGCGYRINKDIVAAIKINSSF